MISRKWKYTTAVFEANQEAILKDKNFKKFIKDNEEWLMPYSAFLCFERQIQNAPILMNGRLIKNMLPEK